MGIAALITGRITVGKAWTSGTPARIAGFVLILPLPFAIMVWEAMGINLRLYKTVSFAISASAVRL